MRLLNVHGMKQLSFAITKSQLGLIHVVGDAWYFDDYIKYEKLFGSMRLSGKNTDALAKISLKRLGVWVLTSGLKRRGKELLMSLSLKRKLLV